MKYQHHVNHSYSLILPLLSLFFVVVFIIQPILAQNSQAIKIATDPLIGGLPLFVTLNQSLLDQEGITYSTDFFPTSSKVAQSMVSGQYQVGGPISLLDVIILESKSPGLLKVFTIMAEDASKPVSHILVKRDSPYKTIEDLKGKKLGIGPGAIFEFLSKILLKKYNVENVQLVVVPPGAWIPSLEAGKIDAVFSVEPFSTISLKNNVSRIILSGAQAAVINPIPVVGIAFTNEFIKNNPTEAEKIVKAIDKGTAISKEKPQEAKQTLVKYVNLDKNIAQDVSLNVFYNSTELSLIAPQVQKYADTVYQEGYIDKKINATNFLYGNR